MTFYHAWASINKVPWEIDRHTSTRSKIETESILRFIPYQLYKEGVVWHVCLPVHSHREQKTSLFRLQSLSCPLLTGKRSKTYLVHNPRNNPHEPILCVIRFLIFQRDYFLPKLYEKIWLIILYIIKDFKVIFPLGPVGWHILKTWLLDKYFFLLLDAL